MTKWMLKMDHWISVASWNSFACSNAGRHKARTWWQPYLCTFQLVLIFSSSSIWPHFSYFSCRKSLTSRQVESVFGFSLQVGGWMTRRNSKPSHSLAGKYLLLKIVFPSAVRPTGPGRVPERRNVLAEMAVKYLVFFFCCVRRAGNSSRAENLIKINCTFFDMLQLANCWPNDRTKRTDGRMDGWGSCGLGLRSALFLSVSFHSASPRHNVTFTRIPSTYRSGSRDE